MTPIEITTSKGTWLFVPVPEPGEYELRHLGSPQMSGKNQPTVCLLKNGARQIVCTLPAGEYEIISLLSQLTEEQAAGIVESGGHPAENSPCYKDYKDSQDFVCSDALTSFHSLLAANKCYTENPYWHPGTEKPLGEVEVSYDGGKTWDSSVEWTETRTCMMAGSAGGFGYFGEGWATSRESGTDVGLICDPPDYWRYAANAEYAEKAQSRTSKERLILEVKK